MTMIDSPLWVEKYRPQKLEDCILPNSIKRVFGGILKQKMIPNLLLCGSAGTGKTTVAKALCKELGYNVLFMNASEERGITVLRDKIISYASALSFDGERKALILDEADHMTPDAQAALRSVMEQCSANCAFILTCNFKDRIIVPLHSRCAVHEFRINRDEKKDVLADLFTRIKYILNSENVKFDPKVLSAVIVKHFPDFRRIINQLQSYSQIENEINEGILSFVNEIHISKLYAALKEKKFNTVREWVVENLDNDPSRIYRRIYDGLKDFLVPTSIPKAILILADYQYKSSFSADQEVVLLACLISIMIDCEFN